LVPSFGSLRELEINAVETVRGKVLSVEELAHFGVSPGAKIRALDLSAVTLPEQD